MLKHLNMLLEPRQLQNEFSLKLSTLQLFLTVTRGHKSFSVAEMSTFKARPENNAAGPHSLYIFTYCQIGQDKVPLAMDLLKLGYIHPCGKFSRDYNHLHRQLRSTNNSLYYNIVEPQILC